MEREANYITVGAFVLLVIALASAFVIWYTDRGDRREYSRYEIYFNGSVSGLSRGSPVRYLGVDVGRVVDITLDDRTPDRVAVVVRDCLAGPAAARRTPRRRSGPVRRSAHRETAESDPEPVLAPAPPA